MITKLYQHLVASVSLVNGRVYPLIMPQGTTKPALVYTIVNDRDNQGASGCVSSSTARIQIDIYADSYLSVTEVLTEVKEALYSFSMIPTNLNVIDGFEEEEQLFRKIIDFKMRS